ncbi:MAG: hypothetical protein QXH37_05070 [Candidatus Bathyarchaeia archaeon]
MGKCFNRMAGGPRGSGVDTAAGRKNFEYPNSPTRVQAFLSRILEGSRHGDRLADILFYDGIFSKEHCQ